MVIADRRNSNPAVGLVCFPRDGAVIDAVRAVVNHLETEPMKQLESLSRRNAALIALATAYRCKAFK